MFAIVDVHYLEDRARAACVLASSWDAASALDSWTVELGGIAPYQPGLFFERELPCLMAVLNRAPRVDQIAIDGYVWLDEAHRPGLDVHLFNALNQVTPVVGIAKTAFKGSPMAERVERPSSKKPLFVTSAGLEAKVAADNVRTMHGPARIPTLVALVDRLSRGGK